MLMSADNLEILSNHIALPTQLPGCQDNDLNEIGIQLIHRLLIATSKILDIAHSDHKNVWNSLHQSLSLTLSVHAYDGLSKPKVISALQSLNNHDFVLFHVMEQNAGIKVTLQKSKNEENFLFELSEASPKCEDVLASSNALLWEFPSCAVSIPKSSYNDYDLEDELATFLVRASSESVKHVAAHTKKANSLAYESRDTVDPILISGVLMTILKNQGTESYPPLLTKRVQDDVCWDGSGEIPWRRCPMWLLLRVATEKHLCGILEWEIGHIYYKLLMCLFHSLFLAEYTKSSTAQGDVLQHLTRKLVIRLDKLHGRKSVLRENFASQFNKLYNTLENIFQDSVKCAEKRLSDIIGIQHNPPVLRIPFRAPEKYCKLQLSNSDKYISKVLNISGCSNSNLTSQSQKIVSILPPVTRSNISAMERYIDLAEFESKTEISLRQHQSRKQSHVSCDSRGQELAKSIKDYINRVGILYNDYSEQKSRMLLIVLELWVELDKCTIQSFGLLKNFSPGFTQEITNVLLLSRLDDLERLNRVRNYLINRHKECGNSSLTIFGQPSKNCFAVQYYDNLDETSVMKTSLKQIENDAMKTRIKKKEEWRKNNEIFLTLKAEESIMTHEYKYGGSCTKGCAKCHEIAYIKSFGMEIHEWPLPSDTTIVKTILFELHCPESFSVYRDISWMVLVELASTPPMRIGSEPMFLLRNYNALFMYSTTSKGCVINPLKTIILLCTKLILWHDNRYSDFTLASKTKSFMRTHYAKVKFPAREIDVCLPNGAKFQYFDTKHQIWPSELMRLSFVHHCGLVFPEDSPYSSFCENLDLKINIPEPSSYAIVASQLKCPDGAPIYEYLSMQTLLSGFRHRWLQILIELGSSNINFSTESTTGLMNFLSLQVGPRDEEDIRGIIHRVFLDQSFCSRLIYWINWRLDEISSIFRKRDFFHMEILITLAIRLFELGGHSDRIEGCNILKKARDTSLKWLSDLQIEHKHANSNETLQKLAQCVIWTALLCRRTFVVFIGMSSIPHDFVSSYLESSISLQEHLNDDDSAFSLSLKAALIRDAKMIWDLRYSLRASIRLEMLVPILLVHAPSLALPDTSQKIPQFLKAPRDWWVEIITENSEIFRQQQVNFNILTGHLLIDGKPIGKLSKEWRDSKIYKRLFGVEVIHVWSSQLSGMDYVFDQLRCEHEIHFGTKNGEKIIQALKKQELLEFLPFEIFFGSQISDLPSYLINSCAHWLNFETKCIEIRQIANPWRHGPTDWTIDLNRRTATFVQSNKRLTLIDPYSRLFKKICRIFQGLEISSEILTIQANTGGIKVVLPRLELKFQINESRLFECAQLRSEIDPNQDIRTWYGLKTKLVLRGVERSPISQKTASRVKICRKSNYRILLVPSGNISYKKVGASSEIFIDKNGGYARFIVNEVLGRIETVNPSDEYLKALYHAVTSRLTPDPLTGRTGTEEAIHCLSSAYCQPASPLSDKQIEILQKIADLTPHRSFYPIHKKTMQVTYWNQNLSTSVQHDGFRAMVDQIWEKSQQLSKFYSGPSDIERIPGFGIDELNKRNLNRRNLYSRRLSMRSSSVSRDNVYSGHNFQTHNTRLAKIQRCVQVIQNWPQLLPTTTNLEKIFEGWSNFQGFRQSPTEFLISELIDMDIRTHWGSLLSTVRSLDQGSKFKLMFLLSLLSFRKYINMDIVMTLIAFAVFDELKVLEPPHFLFYHGYKNNDSPTVSKIMNLLSTAFELKQEGKEILQATYIAEKVVDQWPCAKPDILQSSRFPRLEKSKVIKLIYPEWSRLYQNYVLSKYISQVQIILNKLRCVSTHGKDGICFDSVSSLQKKFPREPRISEIPCLTTDLLSGNLFCQKLEAAKSQKIATINPGINKNAFLTSSNLNGKRSKPNTCNLRIKKPSVEISNLKEIVNNLSASHSIIDQKYAKDLSQSLDALENNVQFSSEAPKAISDILLRNIENAEQVIQRKLECIQDSCDYFMPTRSRWLKQAGLWPCISPVSLLESLRSTMNCDFGPGVRERITEYAISITNLQRLYRIRDSIMKSNFNRASDELRNPGHENWDPMIHPDWLLLEIEGNILIRPGQIDVAIETISPASGKNSVLQMNMGQGKTSCIMPMAAATLADGSSLARVIVPRALLTQTIQLLQTRLGGLVGREVKHISFSRKLSKIPDIANCYLDQLQRTQKARGIIVTLPEHILSFRLSVYQALSEGSITKSKDMSNAQKWMTDKSRDIIDECDEILSLRTQLIYPSGTQKTIDGHPHRWEIVESLLQRVHMQINTLENIHPETIAISRRIDSGFPLFCFLKAEAEEWLISRLVDDICSGRSQIIPKYSSDDQLAIKDFISITSVSDTVVEKIDLLDIENPVHRQALYLIRGLIAHGILILTLKKRWNVQYGLHPSRDPIAVPYHAKGCPSDQSEWGHPDVALILTCLAFYFEGLKFQQFCQTMKQVSQVSDPIHTYNGLIQGNTLLPVFLGDWNNIIIEDDTQLNELWRYLGRDINVINFFLNKNVFPQYAKQFEHKLQATGWDIPAFILNNDTQRTGTKIPLTTGFSGTNDWKRLLPLTISQQDLPSLLHTNAEVLTYLLQKRNMGYYHAADSSGRRISESDLLKEITKRRISVLLDAGAQIMEMDNLSLVRAWLNIDLKAQAAFYFDTENNPKVLYKNGRSVPFHSSTFSDDLENCLVYLDQVHTRGTDLKLPPTACGALTLGPNQTKDHTVQAAMRLRQLGTTQSVTFFAPPEVHQSILNLQGKGQNANLSSFDVIYWLLKQTCLGIEQLLPLYSMQGHDFCTRAQAALTYTKLHDPSSQDFEKFLSIVQPREDQTLVELYGTKKNDKEMLFHYWDPAISSLLEQLKDRCKDFVDFENGHHSASFNEAQNEVEQEREVAHEVEIIQQLQNPDSYIPLTFPGLHQDILNFVRNGKTVLNSTGYELAFEFFAKTSIGKNYGINKNLTSQKLFVSMELGRTVKKKGMKYLDHLQRPIHWILWSPTSEEAMVIIPEEVEIIIPMLQKGSYAVHLLTYAAPINRKMLMFNDFTHYNLPPLPQSWYAPLWLRIEIGILSGRFNFDYSEYSSLLELLGVREVEDVIFDGQDDAIKNPKNLSSLTLKKEIGSESFTSKPFFFLQDWLALRSLGIDFCHTPMGYICKGQSVQAEDLFFKRVQFIDIDKSFTASEHETKSHYNYGMTATITEQDDYDYLLDFGNAFDELRDETSIDDIKNLRIFSDSDSDLDLDPELE